MERPNSYRERLVKLECHFKWRPEVGGNDMNIEKFIEKVEKGIDKFPSSRIRSLSILSYLYTIKSSRANPAKALECIEKAKEMMAEASSEGQDRCDFVLSANELHIKYLHCRLDEENLDRLEKEWPELNPKMKAEVWGAKGYIMFKFGFPRYEEAIEAYKEAVTLDDRNPLWHFGQGYALNCQGYTKKGYLHKPSNEEIILLRKACDLGMYKIAKHVSVYGRARSVLYMQEKNEELAVINKRICLQALDTALSLAGTNPVIYARCAKAYRQCEELEKFKECVHEGLTKCISKGKLYHTLGNFYWKNEEEQDISKAQHYLDLSLKESDTENFWAELDLLKIKIQHDSSFDPLGEFARLYGMCTYECAWKAELRKERGIYLLYNGDCGMAIDEILKAVESESNQHYGQVYPVRNEIEEALNQRLQRKGKRNELDGMKDIAWFYQKCMPENHEYLKKSVDWYRKIIEFDRSDEFIVANFCYVLLRLASYNEGPESLVNYKEAIAASEGNASSTIIKELLAEAYLMAATVAKADQELHYRKCIALNCANGAYGLLCLLVDNVKADPSLTFSMHTYNDCATINKIIGDPSAINLLTPPKLYDKQITEKLIQLVLGFSVEAPLGSPKEGNKQSSEPHNLRVDEEFPSTTLRQSRYEMSCDRSSLAKIRQVVFEARYDLDRIHNQFGEQHFPSGKPRCSFPLAVKTDITDREKVKMELSRLIQSPKEDHGGWKNFGHRFKQLLTFLADIQGENRQWLKPWFTLVNKHKHKEVLTLEDFSAISNDPYELAHRVAEFTEKVAAKYQQYMK